MQTKWKRKLNEDRGKKSCSTLNSQWTKGSFRKDARQKLAEQFQVSDKTILRVWTRHQAPDAANERFQMQDCTKIARNWGLSFNNMECRAASLNGREFSFALFAMRNTVLLVQLCLKMSCVQWWTHWDKAIKAKQWLSWQNLAQSSTDWIWRKISCVLSLCKHLCKLDINICVQSLPEFFFCVRWVCVFFETQLFGPPACGTAQMTHSQVWVENQTHCRRLEQGC